MPVSIPGIENLSPAVKYVIAFAIIFVLLALFALILRRLTGGRMSLSNDRGRARQPRLGIVDVYDLDRQRQLILLRRDNVEHLLLVGGPNDVVVETNIVRVPGARLPASAVAGAESADPQPARNVEIAPSRPAPLEVGNGRAQVNPDFSVTTSSDLGANVEPVLKPTRVVAAPPPVPDVVPQRPAPPNRPIPSRATPLPAAPDAGASDMTRQLEAALRRPSAPVEPPRARPVEPPPVRPVEQKPVTPPPPPPAPTPAPPRVDAAPPPLPPRPVAPPPVASAPIPLPSPAPAAQPKVETPPPPPASEPVAAPSPPPASPPATPAAPAGKPDPFSIEDIEAEFARLLGRPLEKRD